MAPLVFGGTEDCDGADYAARMPFAARWRYRATGLAGLRLLASRALMNSGETLSSVMTSLCPPAVFGRTMITTSDSTARDMTSAKAAFSAELKPCGGVELGLASADGLGAAPGIGVMGGKLSSTCPRTVMPVSAMAVGGAGVPALA